MLNCFWEKISFLFLLLILIALPACKDHPEKKAPAKSVLVSKEVPAVQKKLSHNAIAKKTRIVRAADKSNITRGIKLKNRIVSEKSAKPSCEKILASNLEKKQTLYSSKNQIDPFEPLIKPEPEKGSLNVAAASGENKPRLILTPLMKLDFSQMRLVAVVMAPSGNIAMVEDSTNKGYTIRIGTYIGKNGGRVVKIEKDRIIIKEYIRNFKGEMVEHSEILKLNKPDNEG